MNIQEEWRDVIGYEGYYQVSNLGKVRSLDRDIHYINHGTPTVLHMEGKILKQRQDRDGYMRINLHTTHVKNKLLGVHRLVAQAFIPNPNNFPCVNHIDCNKANNCIDNLEWCTVAYNNQYSYNTNYKLQKWCSTLGNRVAKNLSHPVRCIETGQIFPSMIEAERQLGLGSGIVCYSIQLGKPTKEGYTFEKLSKPTDNL